MGIISLVTDLAGQINVNPRRVKLVTTDSLATITTAGYLNPANLMGFTLKPTDFVDTTYLYNTTSRTGTDDVFTVTIAGGVITLIPEVNDGNVLLPVVNGHVPVFNGTTGQIKDAGLVPSDASKLIISMVSTATIIGNLPNFSDIAGTISDSGVVANKVMQASFASPDVNLNIIRISVANVNATALNSGAVNVFTPAVGTIYSVLQARFGGNGNTNFSGGGGDKNISLQIGASVYGTIPAATAQAIANVPVLLGGGTTFAYAAGAAISANITSANPLFVAYTGGATPYSAGVISGEVVLIRLS